MYKNLFADNRDEKTRRRWSLQFGMGNKLWVASNPIKVNPARHGRKLLRHFLD